MLKRCTLKIFPPMVPARPGLQAADKDSTGLTTMFCTADDFVLDLLVKFDKVSTVASDAHDKAAELFGIVLGLA